MALLSNGNNSTLNLTSPGGGSNHISTSSNETASNDHLFLSNLLTSLPRWDNVKTSSNPVPVPQHSNSAISNEALVGSSGGSDVVTNDAFLFSHMLGAIGTQSNSHHANMVPGSSSLTPSSSPHTNSSTSSAHGPQMYPMACGRCDLHAINRCLDCNDALCEDCGIKHQLNPSYNDHVIVPLSNLSPIGSMASISHGSPNLNEPHCDVHAEVLRYVCRCCNKIVCQECTLWDHKEHFCISIAAFVEDAPQKLQSVLDSGKMGKKYIKASIDRAVTFTQSIERDAVEATQRIRKAMRHFVMAIEERERTLLEKVEKCRQQKITILSDQMAGLRAALAGLAQTSDMLTKIVDSVNITSHMELARALTNGESQMQQFATMYKNLQPKEEFIAFSAPNFELLQDIRMQGDVAVVNQRSGTSNGSLPIMPSIIGGGGGGGNILTRRPIVRATSSQLKPISTWEQIPSSLTSSASNVITSSNTPNIGQSIPGSLVHVVAKPAIGPSTSFGFDGHEDGQVSRPWGLCVDKDGNIVVADRRNNRVQVFYPDGTYKLKFGSKGSGNAQFDLPAGISTDPQNRIVVVDKDNHRVQIFSSIGNFILKFGSYGKDCGQFQYPWDVAVNSKGEMLITDSRNHRIQLFNPDGHFISRFSFDGVNHSRSLKGLTTPRGVCFTPHGDIIVSDFENHRLLLIDAGLTKILAAKGHEGSGIQEFSRPSGICCDDEGRVVVADSKNQRVIIFSPLLEFLWVVEIRPSTNSLLPSNLDEKDRPSDVALLPDGRLVVMVETSPDARDTSNPQKTFIQIY